MYARSVRLALAGLACVSALFSQSEPKAVEMAQKLHNQLDQLESRGDLESQQKFFHESVVRMDAFRPMTKGRDKWMALQKSMRTKGQTQVQSTQTTVVSAWQEGGRLYEYGTADLKVKVGEKGAAGRDPVNYFAVWRVNPAPEIEFIIWNTAAPVAALRTFSEIK
jgi:hypothetical protein